MIANPDYAKQVLFKHDMFPKMDLLKGVEGTLLYKFSGGPNIFIANGHDWRAQRTVVSPAFHRSMPIRMFGELAISLFKTMDKMSETIEVTGLIRRYTLDAIGKAGFGFDFNATVDPKSKWVEIYDSINDGLQDPLFFMFPSFDHQWLWLFPKRKAIHDKLDIFLKMMDNVITTKRKDIRQGKVTNDNLEEHEKDILTLMIEAEERGEGILTDTDLKSNLCFFFLAGHDTTLNALSLAIYYLAIHPEIQQRAREEAMHILGKEPVDIAPTLEQTKEMTFINQIIKETLRIHPTAPQVVPRITQQDSVFGDKFIPKGSRVSVDIYCMHHYNKVWPDAETFNPDRFSGNEHTQHGISWLSFSSGARQCLGMNFSLAEQRVVLSMLLRKYDWSLPKDSIHKHGVLTSGLFLAGPKDLEITFKKRY
ncbi:cytochrome P-450 cyp509A1 [Gilbertella persicaria]|uniref:cytochrome P-450 cyp509A1 n=1 Tax=Gilbertella persicaria TaxID=101096 RepID=UPI0022201B10|nr:cytochrome P-450 cyp509A1 [Gilbertella persicaria]KAI8094932.1 cytochrome P-450 cyp509A1 [Gilbertella persicaria]